MDEDFGELERAASASRLEVKVGASYGSQSMVDPLRTVLVRRPDEAFAQADPKIWGYTGRPDLVAARTEHAALVEMLRSSGAEVWYHEEPQEARADAIFVDLGIHGTTGLGRRAYRARRAGRDVAVLGCRGLVPRGAAGGSCRRDLRPRSGPRDGSRGHRPPDGEGAPPRRGGLDCRQPDEAGCPDPRHVAIACDGRRWGSPLDQP